MTVKMAKSLFINDRKILIDGEEFPWDTADEDLKIEYDPHTGWSIVRLPVIIDGPVRIEPR